MAEAESEVQALRSTSIVKQPQQRHRRLIIRDCQFSVLMQPTPLGSRHFPLSGLIDLEPAWQELVLALLKQPPVSDILKLSSYTPAGTDIVPIVAIESPLTTM